VSRMMTWDGSIPNSWRRMGSSLAPRHTSGVCREQKLNRILLKEKGKKTFISAFENRLQESIKHRSLNRNVSYKHLIKLECYKLQKHILNIEEYYPFKMYW